MHREKIVNLYPSVIYSILGGICLYTAKYAESLWFSGVLIVAMLAMFAAAGANFLNWIGYRFVLLYEQYHKSAIKTQASHLADAVRGLGQDELNFLNAVMFDEPLDLDDPYIEINGVKIPEKWIQKHFLHSKSFYLVPQRNYSSGSRAREWAGLVEKLLVSKGVATKHAGNKSARVHSWNQVYEALHWAYEED